MSLSYEDWLCWEDRLLHMNSKVRYAGNVDLKLLCDSITDPKDHRIRELGPLFKETVNDSDVVVQDKALDALIAYLKAADADVAGCYAREICDAIVANCLTDRLETVTKAQIVFMLWVELEAVDAVLDALEKAIKAHVAKPVLPAVDVMVQAIREFGSKIVPPNRLLKMLLEIYDHKDQDIRASSKRLILELCRWIGRGAIKSILFEKMSDTMKNELDAELANVRVAAKPTRKIRSEQAKEPEQKVATDAARSGCSEEYATRFDRDVEPSGLTLKGNESRIESYFQELSITQLKNAEPLEETKQLQKMSLSDSQEQNKKKRQHYGSEKGYRHFVESLWPGDDFLSDEKVEETLVEELMEELEWIKSHKCTMCGLFYDMSCVCQQELELDMDEIRPGLFNYGLDRRYLKRAKSAVSDGGGKNPNDDIWSPPWKDPCYEY